MQVQRGDGHPRYGTFYFGTIYGDFAGFAVSSQGYNFSIGVGHPRTAPSLFNHELGHNILGQLDEKNQAAENVRSHTFHSKYTNYAMWPDGPTPKATYHPNVWKEIDREGILGLPRIDDWRISYGEEPN